MSLTQEQIIEVFARVYVGRWGGQGGVIIDERDTAVAQAFYDLGVSAAVTAQAEHAKLSLAGRSEERRELAKRLLVANFGSGRMSPLSAEGCAELHVIFADALLAELDKEKPQ